MSDEVQATPVQLNFAEIVPADWLRRDNPWIWIACYHAMRLKKQTLTEALRRIDLGDALALILYGSPSYFTAPTVTLQSSDIPVFAHSPVATVVAQEGAYLVLILKYSPPTETDYQARVRELTLRSLLGTVLGENIVYSRLYQNAVRLNPLEVSIIGPAFRNPGSNPPPDISDDRLARARELNAAIGAIEEHERNRVLLSLRWHGEARDGSGIDAFIYQWVALEALGMTDRKNVAPLNGALATAYGITIPEARARFQLGKIFSFRSRIVHSGFIPSINSALLDYLRALYKDVLWQRVGFPSEHAAEEVLHRSGFDLRSFLKVE